MKISQNKIWLYLKAHKILSAVIILVVVYGGYYEYKKSTSTASVPRYVLGAVEKGSIVSTVTGTGQVEASNTIDLKAKASGDITYVGVKPGDVVKKGKTLFALDTRDAQKAVRDAETALEGAQLNLEKFTKAPDDLDVQALKAANDTAAKSKIDAQKSVDTAHRNLLNSSIQAISADPSNNAQAPTISGTYTKDQEVTLTISVKQGGYFSVTSDPEGIVSDTQEITTALALPLGDSGLYIKFASASSSQPNWIITLPNKTVSSYASNLTAYQTALDNQVKTDNDADLTIAQNNDKIQKLYNPDALDLRAQQLAVKQKEDALADAKVNLSDYYVTAPFDGQIASVTGKLADTASGALATIITNQKVATISLNEIDVPKIKLGEKVTLTFDAVEGLTMTGSVAEIDEVGTVSQGVVSYKVKITFDTENDLVKPGMSVSASIITDMKQDVLVVPNSAVKSSAGTSYVEAFDTPPPPATDGLPGSLSKIAPTKIEVTTGLSNDSETEIVSGVAEGDQIVTRTIQPSTTAAKTAAPSIFGSAPATRGGGGGGVRVQTGR